MYLVQSYMLKNSQLTASRFRLPSLEWLERLNSRSLGLSTLLVALGFGSGLVLSSIAHRGDNQHALASDPVVIASAVMLAWLIVAEAFRWLYPAARQGRKVAYLTLASFLFLLATVVAFAVVDSAHGGAEPSASNLPSNLGSG